MPVIASFLASHLSSRDATRRMRSGSEVRSSFRQHGRFFEKNDLTPPKYEMTLSTPGKYEREILPWSGNGQTLALPRHAAAGVAGAQGLHGL